LLKTHGLAVEYFPGYINRKVSMHGLDVVLVSVILRGRGQHLIGSDTYEETGGSLAVTHYGQEHDIVTDRRGMDVINLYLDLKAHPLPRLPDGLQSVLPLLLPLHRNFQHRLNRIVRLQFDDPKPLADLLFAIQRELDEKLDGYRDAVTHLFTCFLILCCRHAIRSGFVPSEPIPDSHSALENLKTYLDNRFADAHTLDSLAKQAGFSRHYLCRTFKAYTGKGVFDYLIERRIQAAMIRLRSGEDKILAIALECGFNDLSYFNRKFKQLVGISPTQYRKPPGDLN
jgi:AraC-like DNA-binding protein